MEQPPRHIRNPFGLAWREARVLLVLFVVVAGVYMGFAADAPPLVHQARPVTPVDTAAMSAGDTTLTTPSIAETDSASVPAIIDTTMTTPGEAPVGNGDSLVLARAELAQKQKTQDSLKQIAQAKRDSAKGAQSIPPQEDPQAFLARVAKLKAIDTETAKKLFDMKGAIFIDARQEEAFMKGHIPGAINMYANSFNQYVPQLVQIPVDRQIVIYCNGGSCDLSHDLADQILAIGLHKKVVVYTGGVDEWKAKNYPYGP